MNINSSNSNTLFKQKRQVKLFTAFSLIMCCVCYGQVGNSSRSWTENEKHQYSTLYKLANYIYKKDESEISKDTLYGKYIYFDNVLNDTLVERKNKRMVAFDDLFPYFKNTIDSIGLKNLDARPVRFYKNHKIYEPFDRSKAKESLSGEKLYRRDTNVFAYFKKDEPDHPLGVLLFEGTSNKLASWIMVNQGGYKYFLTFNLF